MKRLCLFATLLLAGLFGLQAQESESHLPRILGLYVGGSGISSLDVSGCTALEWLHCYDNELTSLDVSSLSDLKSLYCHNNKLTSLDVSSLSALKTLYCYNNKLTSLDVSGLSALTELDCGNNELTSLHVSGCTALTELDCGNNELTSLHVSGCTDLTELDCGNNELTSLDVSDLSSLRYLSCDGNHIPLSILYGIYKQREQWNTFGILNQSDTITLWRCLPWDLSSERMLGKAETTFTLKDASGNDVSMDSYTQNDFVFQFTPSFKGTLTLHNFLLDQGWNNCPTFTYYITVDDCFSVDVSANHDDRGSVSQSGNGTYFQDSLIRITATANEGYRFLNWTKGNEVFGTKADTTFKASENLALVAHFEAVYTVSVSSDNPEWGSVSQSGDGTYFQDSLIRITATANEGYRFVNWTKDNEVFGTKADTTFKVTGNLALVAHFEVVYTVSVSSDNPEWGSVSRTGDGIYGADESITITATANEGYRFVKWMKDGEIFGTKADTTFKASENLVLVAYFESIYTVSVSSNNSEWGRVSRTGDGIYGADENITITATANEGYRFVNWTKKDGAVFSQEAVHSFTVTENLELKANFEKIPDDVANENRQDDNFSIYVQDRTIYLSESIGVVQVYNVAGQCVYSGVATAIAVRHSGVYIVRVGARGYKVVVK